MTPTQLQAWIRNKSIATGIPAEVLSRSYMMGKLVEQIAESEYKDRFIIKGGFLLGAMFGIENRSTMDIDTSVRNLSLVAEELEKIFETIFKIPSKEGIRFRITKFQNIRENSSYPGIRMNLIAQLEKMKVDIKMDITTGEVLYSEMVKYRYELLFENRFIEIMVYPVEQILAEKLQTMIYLEDDNTRARDFYDIYILYLMGKIDYEKLYKALRRTCTIRGMDDSLRNYYKESWTIISKSPRLASHWERYRNSERNPYAKKLTFPEIMEACNAILSEVLAVEEKALQE